jgi:hypothetical protein
VAAGENVTFTAVATPSTATYQWLFNCHPLEGQTNASLTVPNVGPAQVGLYSVLVRSGTREIESDRATLQINSTGGQVVKTFARDKLGDVLVAPRALLQQAISRDRRAARRHFVSIPQGSTGLQIFNTFGATKEPGETNHCGVPGGASYWFAIRADSDGLLTVSTEGSEFNTVLAVYTWPSILEPKMEVGCDDNSGRDGEDSILRFNARAGTIYYVAVDGVNGATGTVRLSYALDEALLSFKPERRLQGFGSQIGGTPGRKYRVEATTDFTRWFTLLTTNLTNGASFSFTDTNTARYPHRFYRAVPVP